MKVLITGSNGFIGTGLRAALTAAQIPFDTVQRLPTSSSSGESRYETLDSQHGTWHVHWPQGLSEIGYSEYSTVVHLALAQSTDAAEKSIALHTVPLEVILAGIKKHGSGCALLYMSSQSSAPGAISGYGRGKWAGEAVIRASTSPWTIIKPGLIIGPSAKGLFAAILRLLRRFPIIPVPVGNRMCVQPVLLEDVTAACIAIVRSPKEHDRQTYELALPPQPLIQLIRETSSLLSLKRVILPIPWQLVSLSLRMCEFLPIRLPVSRDNLEGLLASRELVPQRSLGALGISLHCLSKDALVGTDGIDVLEEGRFLFSKLFGQQPPEEFVQRYAEAQRPHLLNGCWIDMEKIVRRGLDVEAIEFATRRRKTILSQKLYIACYVAELFPSLLTRFVNKNHSRLKGWIILGFAGVSSAWKLVYGTYLVKRYKLLEGGRRD